MLLKLNKLKIINLLLIFIFLSFLGYYYIVNNNEEPKSFNIFLELNNGNSTVMSKTAYKGPVKLSRSDLPYYPHDGYLLEGWYFDSSLTNKFTETFRLKEDITLYAKWITPPNGKIDNVTYITEYDESKYLYQYVTFNITYSESSFTPFILVKKNNEELYRQLLDTLSKEQKLGWDVNKPDEINLATNDGSNTQIIDSVLLFPPKEIKITHLTTGSSIINSNDNFILNIKLDNPENLEIIKVIINGESYERSLFLSESNKNLIKININAGNQTGVKNFCVEQIEANYINENAYFYPYNNIVEIYVQD